MDNMGSTGRDMIFIAVLPILAGAILGYLINFTVISHGTSQRDDAASPAAAHGRPYAGPCLDTRPVDMEYACRERGLPGFVSAR